MYSKSATPVLWLAHPRRSQLQRSGKHENAEVQNQKTAGKNKNGTEFVFESAFFFFFFPVRMVRVYECTSGKTMKLRRAQLRLLGLRSMPSAVGGPP